MNAEMAQGFDAFGHQAFAAGLVYRRLLVIGNNDTKTALPRGNGHCQARRASARDKDIGDFSHLRHPVSFSPTQKFKQ
jgi:hypothetical protein